MNPALVATVKVKADNEQGFVIINRSDLDRNVHELLDVDDAPDNSSLSIDKLNVNDAKLAIAAVNDVEHLNILEQQEFGGKGRGSVLAAINHRREELKG